VVCSSDSWDSCTFTTSHNCVHSEDVHLACATEDSMMFRLVNANGETIDSDSGERGLLLYYGSTVCDDGFNDNSADAICREMGYALGADSWENGQFYDIQSSYDIGLDDVICSSDSWDSCEFTTSHNCAHSEDVHLACAVETAPFTLVNDEGQTLDVTHEQSAGLLLFDGQTVCDDGFSDNSANAICREMGYSRARSWRSGYFYVIQPNYDIGLDDVVCSSDSWDSCTYTSSHNCGHDEDVHLVCEGGSDGSCSFNMEEGVPYCCNHPDYYYHPRCTSGAERGQLISLFTIATTAVITALIL